MREGYVDMAHKLLAHPTKKWTKGRRKHYKGWENIKRINRTKRLEDVWYSLLKRAGVL